MNESLIAASVRDFPKVTIKDATIINKQSTDTLAGWACQINTFRWPAELPGHPDGTWTYRPDGVFKKFLKCLLGVPTGITTLREHQLIEYITHVIGDRVVLRKYNSHMSDEQFDDLVFLPSKDYFKKYYHVTTPTWRTD